MNIHFPLVLLVVAASVRGDKARNVASNGEKSGSYHEAHESGSSFVVKDVIEAGDLEFYGKNVKPADMVIDEDEVVEVDDDDAELFEFIHDMFENSDQAKYIENFEDVLFDTVTTLDASLDQRDLILNLPSIYCNCPSQHYYFNIEISITPSSDARTEFCSLTRQKSLGNHINAMLWDLGVGSAGAGDSVVFLARVCNVPRTFRRELLAGGNEEAEDRAVMEQDETAEERELTRRLYGFVYAGGSVCKGCSGDNADRRKLQITASCSGSSCSISTTSTSCAGSDCTTINTFCSASGTNNCGCNLDFYGFLTDLNERIKQYLKTSVVPRNTICTGTMPGISVTLTAVSSNELKYGC